MKTSPTRTTTTETEACRSPRCCPAGVPIDEAETAALETATGEPHESFTEKENGPLGRTVLKGRRYSKEGAEHTVCALFDLDTGLCTAYAARPETCASYPCPH